MKNIANLIIDHYQTDILETIKKEIVNCIINKSQIRTVIRRDEQRSYEGYYNKNDFINIAHLEKSVFLCYNTIDQYLYVIKKFYKNDSNFSHEIGFCELVGNECPFISKFYGKIQTNSQKSIMIEYIEGQTLHNFIIKNKSNSIDNNQFICIIPF